MTATVVALSAGAMTTVALYHLTRLGRLMRARVRAGADLDVGHAAMAVAMSAMLLGSAGSTGPFAGLAMGFALAALWFGVRALRAFVVFGAGAVAPLAQPAVGCAAMVLMLAGAGLLPGSSAHSMAGMSLHTTVAGGLGAQTRSVGVAAVVVIVATVVLAIWTVRRWQLGPERPRLALGCQLAMNVTTVAMLTLV